MLRSHCCKYPKEKYDIVNRETETKIIILMLIDEIKINRETILLIGQECIDPLW